MPANTRWRDATATFRKCRSSDNDDSTALEKSVPAVKMRTIIGMGTCRSQVELVEDLDNASLASLQVDAELHLHTHTTGINCGLILPATSIVSASPF